MSYGIEFIITFKKKFNFKAFRKRKISFANRNE